MKANRKKDKIIALTAASMLVLAVLSTAVAQERLLVPMGCTVGVSVKTQGVMVVGLSKDKEDGKKTPAAQAGLLPGDIIVAVGERTISSGEDFKAAVSEMNGDEITIGIIRAGEKLQLRLKPAMEENAPQLGLWLRDGIAGIGTLTFYDPQTGMYGGLGHGVNDAQSGILVSLGRGEIYRSSVSEVKKGLPGAPGELSGQPQPENICGDIRMNTTSGIFGFLKAGCPTKDKAIPVATDSEIKLGEATILANVSGTDVTEYKVEIIRVYHGESSGRSLMLNVTDSRLLELTGGIVQGMSGSPILQNGKLIGAVTHVMVNDPTKGFGISAENMLKTADSESWTHPSENAA